MVALASFHPPAPWAQGDPEMDAPRSRSPVPAGSHFWVKRWNRGPGPRLRGDETQIRLSSVVLIEECHENGRSNPITPPDSLTQAHSPHRLALPGQSNSDGRSNPTEPARLGRRQIRPRPSSFHGPTRAATPVSSNHQDETLGARVLGNWSIEANSRESPSAATPWLCGAYEEHGLSRIGTVPRERTRRECRIEAGATAGGSGAENRKMKVVQPRGGCNVSRERSNRFRWPVRCRASRKTRSVGHGRTTFESGRR